MLSATPRRRRPTAVHARPHARRGSLPLDALLGLAATVAAGVVSCCLGGPAAIVVTAHVTLSAVGGLGAGAAIVVGACVIRNAARGH